MAYRIPDLPSTEAYIEELADFWEVQALLKPNQSISHQDLLRTLAYELDELNHDGIESEDDKLSNKISEAMLHIEERKAWLEERYPFEIGLSSLKLPAESDDIFKHGYIFMLLSTRFNMNDHKIQNSINSTDLFEEMCAYVAKCFFGKSAESYVFGTASSLGFKEKVEDLIEQLGEGGRFLNRDFNSPVKNDGGLDVVVWKDFSDKKVGKLIGFGQCKTGTTWKSKIHEFKPKDFCSNWFENPLVHDPVSIVFICDTLNHQMNFVSGQRGYLFLNRFRIMEYLDSNLPTQIQEDITAWVDGALETARGLS